MTCVSCAEASERGLLGDLKKRDNAFISRGFDTWRIACKKFTRHENSNCHKEAVKRLLETGSPSSTALLIATGRAKEQDDNRVALRFIFHAVILLSAQGLPLRRRDEASGNLRQTLQTMALESPQLTKWLKRQEHGRQSFLSPEIQRQIQRQLAHTVLREVSAEVASAGAFAIIVDETTDITRREQKSICLRFVTEKFTVKEVFVGLYETDLTTGERLASLILDALQRLELPITSLRGQCYDGASNMSGEFRGKLRQH